MHQRSFIEAAIKFDVLYILQDLKPPNGAMDQILWAPLDVPPQKKRKGLLYGGLDFSGMDVS